MALTRTRAPRCRSSSRPSAGRSTSVAPPAPTRPASCREERARAPYVYRKPAEEDDGWPVATLEEVGLSRAAISRFVQLLVETPIDSVHAPEIHGVLIARHGKLALEEYFHGFHRDALHDTRSASKSLASVLAGAAIL